MLVQEVAPIFAMAFRMRVVVYCRIKEKDWTTTDFDGRGGGMVVTVKTGTKAFLSDWSETIGLVFVNGHIDFFNHDLWLSTKEHEADQSFTTE